MQIIDQQNDETLWETDLSTGEKFTLEYTHSVDMTPIIETYTFNDDYSIIVLEVKNKMIGAGVEFNPSVGQMILNGEWVELKNLNRRIDNYLIRVGEIADQEFSFSDTSIRLLDIAKPGDLLKLHISNKRK